MRDGRRWRQTSSSWRSALDAVDASPPFAADAERLRLLYRLPLSGRERRIFVMGSGAVAERLLDIAECGAEVVSREDIAATGEPEFDAVMLPLQVLGNHADGLGELAAKPLSVIFDQAYRSMRPGGVLVGHLDHVLSLAAARTAVRGRISWAGWRRWSGVSTGSGCLETLRAAGFEVPECFYVEPRITAPMSIVPLAWRPARTHFLRAIHRTHEHYSPAGYVLRLLLAHLGLGGWLQPHLFFWARRPSC